MNREKMKKLTILTPEEIEKVRIDIRPFPIQSGYVLGENGESVQPPTRYSQCTIPWWLAEEAYKFYAEKFGTSQSLERLSERGGFGREELLMYLRKSLQSKLW